ncbi:hypothetical protein GCM10011387_01570 [Pedobacter quisquiliarum]|uniref:Uncharacterized protein n=1 Tax=Pedobacter quisquiliarum TaxID=1834438 RepID=A0A916X7H6_9SPHI|nr:hypothetical protein [Pedobacter quisquiliarum]GGC51807.1 hypothetical protein GCM10011387_01570 [Pedobacter quisquiliarum]
MDERLSEQDLYDFNIAFDERLGMYKLSAVLCYDLDTNMLYCYDSKGNVMIPISKEIKTRQDISDLYALLFNL